MSKDTKFQVAIPSLGLKGLEGTKLTDAEGREIGKVSAVGEAGEDGRAEILAEITDPYMENLIKRGRQPTFSIGAKVDFDPDVPEER